MGVLSLLLGGLGVFPVIYDNFVRFRQVYVSVSLYIYSIEEPGAVGDTGCAAWGLADPLPLHSFFSPSSFFCVGVVWVGRGGIWLGYMLHVCYTISNRCCQSA